MMYADLEGHVVVPMRGIISYVLMFIFIISCLYFCIQLVQKKAIYIYCYYFLTCFAAYFVDKIVLSEFEI